MTQDLPKSNKILSSFPALKNVKSQKFMTGIWLVNYARLHSE